MVELARRSFITGLIALVAAPAIVRAHSIMAVKAMSPTEEIWALLARRVKAAEEEMMRHLNECLEREFYGARPHIGGLAILLDDTRVRDIENGPRAYWPHRQVTVGIAFHG